MDIKDIAEQSYRNGYKQGINDFEKNVSNRLVREIGLMPPSVLQIVEKVWKELSAVENIKK